jgi:FtsK/SpoIIIE family
MTGATRYVAGRHGGIAALTAGWWLLGQPGVVVGLVAGSMAGVAHLPADLCLMTAVVAGSGVAGLAVYRRHIGITARLRRAMVEVGLVYRKDYRTVIGPRLRGRVQREGRNLVLRWELPTGVTLRRVREHLEELEQRCGVGMWCRLEGNRLHMEVRRHPLPDRVDFDDFYAAARPGGELPAGLGRSRVGWLWVDLALLPHLLIGGIAGGGKSVFLRQVLTWLTLQRQPSQLRLLLLDFKGGIELARFGELPHALRPVVSDVLAAPDALLEVKAEMDRRLAEMRSARVNDIDAWHDAGLPRWPRLVVVVDELAQLTIGVLGGKENDAARAAQKASTGLLCELGRLGRAAGVHLILCTQRPDHEIIPGELKAVCGGTVAFRVRSIANSQILLDCDRAALLPPHPGRAVWAHEGLEEFQAIYLDSEEGFRRLEERWLREADHIADPGGVSRWTPAPAPGLTARCLGPLRAAAAAVATQLRVVGDRSITTMAAIKEHASRLPRVRGEGGGPPSAGQGDGAQELDAVEVDHETPVDEAQPADSPLLTTPDARPALRVQGMDSEDPCPEEELLTVIGGAGWPGGDDVGDQLADELIAVDPFPEGGTDHVSQCHQSTWQPSDVDEASA